MQVCLCCCCSSVDRFFVSCVSKTRVGFQILVGCGKRCTIHFDLVLFRLNIQNTRPKKIFENNSNSVERRNHDDAFANRALDIT